jgi:aminomethyltransferase
MVMRLRMPKEISMGKGVGLGYVKTSHAKLGEQIHVKIRKKTVPATIVKPPFYKV